MTTYLTIFHADPIHIPFGGEKIAEKYIAVAKTETEKFTEDEKNCHGMSEYFGVIFRNTNHIDTNWTETCRNENITPVIAQPRSTSMGDIIHAKNETGEYWFLCAMVGWEKLENPDAKFINS